MKVRQFVLSRRGLLVSSACCLSVAAYVGMPASFADTIYRVGQDTQLPLEALAVEQVNANDPGDVVPPVDQILYAQATQWSAAAPRHVTANHTASARMHGVKRSIGFDDFKHWT